MKFTHRDGSYFDDHDRNETVDDTIQRWCPVLADEIARIEGLLAANR